LAANSFGPKFPAASRQVATLAHRWCQTIKIALTERPKYDAMSSMDLRWFTLISIIRSRSAFFQVLRFKDNGLISCALRALGASTVIYRVLAASMLRPGRYAAMSSLRRPSRFFCINIASSSGRHLDLVVPLVATDGLPVLSPSNRRSTYARVMPPPIAAAMRHCAKPCRWSSRSLRS